MTAEIGRSAGQGIRAHRSPGWRGQARESFDDYNTVIRPGDGKTKFVVLEAETVVALVGIETLVSLEL